MGEDPSSSARRVHSQGGDNGSGDRGRELDVCADMAWDEEIELYGRRFTFRFTARPEMRRVEVEILEGAGAAARAYVRTPVRGRTTEDARERAWEVLRNYAGLDRYLALVARVVAAVAPDTTLAVEEDARMIRVDLRGPRRLRFPLTLVREDAVDPERTEEELTTFILAHLEAYLEPR